MSQRQPPRERNPRQPAPPFGPRGGLAGASDDFGSYLQPRSRRLDAGEDSDWSGWSPRGVYGRGADLDRTDHGPFEPPDTDERVEQDFVEHADRDFGGRDTAGWYARHGSNADRQQARRRWQAEHAERDWARGEEIDHDYHLQAGARDFSGRRGGHYRPAARNPAWPGWGRGYGGDYGAYGGDYSGEAEDHYQAWPGHDFPGGRGLPARNVGAAPGQPGLAEPSHGSSPSRQADSFRGLAPAGYRRSDQRISDDLHQRLTEDPWVDARAVELDVQDGHVTLRGEVDERAMKHRCEDIAAVCPGVTGISNGIRVRARAFTRADQRAP